MIVKKSNAFTDFFWNDNSGPIENILGLVEYGYMFLGGFWGKAIITISTVVGLSLRDLGKKLDSTFGLTSLEDLVNLPDDASADALFKSSLLGNKSILTTAQIEKISKVSALSGILKMLKSIASKILGGGLLSLLTLKGIQALTAGTDGDSESNKDTNNSVTNKIEDSKRDLERAISKALVS